jgi:hypothetical protein
MAGRDDIGVIFMAVFIPLIVIIAYLYLCCRCHRQPGRRTTPSLPRFMPPPSKSMHPSLPFQPAHFAAPRHGEVPFSPHINHRPFAQPHSMRHGGRRALRPNRTPYTPSGNQLQEGQVPSEVVDDLFLAPEMWQGQSRWAQRPGPGQDDSMMLQRPHEVRDGRYAGPEMGGVRM